jgi:Cft2 family RNA processing exonuclease
MFYWDDGLKLAGADLAIDFRRRQPRAFISHAHIDHMARHEYALCTPQTARLYQARFGPRRTLELPCRQPIDWGGLRLTTYPAGHCLGSAMLLAEDGRRSLLYTGDFKLGPSATCEPAELPRADLLIIESTYGTPDYRLPPRDDAIEKFLSLVRQTLERGQTPVVEAYVLGKGQEITRILTAAGFPVLQHREISAISRVYDACGVSLGPYRVLAGRPAVDQVIVVPPRTPRFEGLREVRFAVTGWAIDPRAKYRLRVDHAIPLSDHADYDALLEAVRQVQPKKVFCTHGPGSFVDRLRELGYDAYPLERCSDVQRRLF